METFDLICKIRNQGVDLSSHRGKIHAGPKFNLTDVIRKQIIEHKNTLLLYLQVESACSGLSVNASEVIARFLSSEDEIELIKNKVSEASLRLHIEIWLAEGMPHQSGKA